MTTTMHEAEAAAKPSTLTEAERTALIQRMAELQGMTTPQIKRRYIDVFGEASGSNNRTFLIRRIAWRLQADTYGGLSDRARERAEELADDADLRISMPRSVAMPAPPPVERRLPGAANRLLPGRVLTRDYNGKRYEVMVLEDGYQYAGRKYKSLSAIANLITGAHWSGNRFFGLAGKKD